MSERLRLIATLNQESERQGQAPKSVKDGATRRQGAFGGWLTSGLFYTRHALNRIRHSTLILIRHPAT